MRDVVLARMHRVKTVLRKRFRFSICGLLLTMLVCSLPLGFWAAGEPARQAALNSYHENQMRAVMFGLQNHCDQRGDLPPSVLIAGNGRPAHSWRLVLLDYVPGVGMGMASRTDWSKPWNHPSNQRWAENYSLFWTLDPFAGHRDRTSMLAVTGPGTAFPSRLPVSINGRYPPGMTLDQITDGLENTILIAEIADSDIHWMEPRDLDIDTMSFRINDKSTPSISSRNPGGPLVGFADGEVFRVSPSIPPEMLRGLCTIAGGEDIDRKELIEQGYLK